MCKLFLSAALAGLLAGCAGSADPWQGEFARHYQPADGEGRALDHNDRVYHGGDGTYYCQRADGTLGLVAMADGGALPPDLIDSGESRKLGAIVARPGGAAVGAAIEARTLRCV
jgi:hypothetical protein